MLLQLPRENDLQLPAMMGLRWEDNRLVLVINPEKLANVRNDELQSLLEHEALHLIWMHPLRYASSRFSTDCNRCSGKPVFN